MIPLMSDIVRKTGEAPSGVARERSSSLLAGKVFLVALILLAVWAFFVLDLSQYLSFEALKEHRERLLAYTQGHYVLAVALFIIIYCVTAALSLPGDVFLTVIGGFLFGSVVGTFYVNIGATSGATLAFLAARYLLRDWVESKFGDRLVPIQEGFEQNAFSYLVMLRLIPAIPFVLVNLVAGLTRVQLGIYVRATVLGMIPASFVFAYAGRQLGMINSPGEIASPPVLLALTLLGLLALTPVLYRRLVDKKTQRKLSELRIA